MNPNQSQKLVVTALIRNDEGKIFLQRRLGKRFVDAHAKWEFPGGKVDFGETPEEAVIRECKEEISCDVRVVRLLPTVWTRIWHRSDGGEVQCFVLCYEAEIVSGEPIPEEGKVDEMSWYAEEEVLALDTLPGIPEFLLAAKQ